MNMKRTKNILSVLLGVAFLISCVEVDKEVNKIGDGPNLAGFQDAAQSVTFIADGNEYPVYVKVKLTGPNLSKVSGDVTVTMAADPSSTAVENTHYRFDNTSITLKENQNYLGIFEFTMLTEGIRAPLAESPVLVLTASDVTASANIVGSGKPNIITLNYGCPSELQGTYDVEVLRDGGPISPYSVVNIAKLDIGVYRTDKVGHWDDIGGTPGYTFYEVCNVITGPQQNLVELYSNQVQNITGSVNPDNGVLQIEYEIYSPSWSSIYNTTYTPQ
ncbi:MAG TPA: hypothetical protein DDX98_04840 [Bacteroidales bacterium]|jgi:hypothetical protein|nr:hypothetical protein [Bacteroidales bacterium]